jgi:hypothetical protein
MDPQITVKATRLIASLRLYLLIYATTLTRTRGMLWIRTGFRIVRKEDSSDQKYETASSSAERIK